MILRVEWYGTVASFVAPDGAASLSPPARPGLVVATTAELGADLVVEVVEVDTGVEVRVDGEVAGSFPSLEAAWVDGWRELELEVAARSADPVFIHAGAVAIGDQGFVLPGRSGVGKTTLVLHLVQELGAVYLSDEYALLDRDACVHPYPRDPHVRSEPGGRGVVTAISAYTDRVGTEPVRVAGVIVAHRSVGSAWAPRAAKARDCALSLLDNAVGARTRTPSVMDAVASVAEAAWCVQGPRDDLGEVSAWLRNRIPMS